MADAILHEGELWLVDFSPRMSSSGTKMLYHVCGNLSYAKNVIHATLGEARKMTGTNPTMPTYYSFIPFPKGTVTNVSYPYIEQYEDARIVEAFTPITGISRLFEMRNDVQVADRGWIIASSTTETRSDAQNLVEAFIRDIQYDIS
jgi:hypothetical protein